VSPGAPHPARERAVARLRAHRWPPAALEALARLRAGGGQAYLVGGSVRDVLLGRPLIGPLDVATDRLPREVARLFERVQLIGIEHGTVLALLGEATLEVTTFRREGGYADARHPDRVTFAGVDLRADLARRDFTVNALAWDPAEGVLVDEHGGLDDLEARVLRAVGDPLARFREDALRPLRAARFAATLGFALEPATRAALGGVEDRARQVAAERVREELSRMLAAPRPSVGLDLLTGAGLLRLWLPEVDACRGVTQNRYHSHDVYEHTLRVVDGAAADRPVVRWAALLHDVGKPVTRRERAGSPAESTFYEHEGVGADLADRALERLRVPVAFRAAVVHLVRQHMFFYRPEWSDATVRRLVRRVGEEALPDLLELKRADAAGKGPEGGPEDLDELRARVDRVLAEGHALHVGDLAVDGADVMRVLGVEPGPRVGAVLEALLDEALEDPAGNTRERLLARLEERRREADRGPREA
jgi:tRNA nucleotidyltransferase (CCA-adding enzyme)